MIRLFGCKKAQADSYFAVIAALFALALSFIISMLVLTTFTTQFIATGYCDATCQSTAANFAWALRLFDSIIIIVVVTLIIAVGLTSYKLPASAAFFVISFLFAPILGYVSYFFNYVFSQIVSQAAFDAVRAFFPRTILVCTNFHWVALVVFVVGSITLFAKKEQGQFVGGE